MTSDRKKICIYTNHFNPEQFKVNDIALELIQEGMDVKVITQCPNYPSGSFHDGYGLFKRRKERINDHLEVVRLPVIPRGTKPIMLIINYASYVVSSFFYALFTRDKADAVLVYCTSPIFIAWAGLRFAKRRNISATLYLMDLWPGNLFAMFNVKQAFLRNVLRKMCIKIYNRFNHILVSSAQFIDVLEGYGVDKRSITYLPQHAEFDDYKWQKPQDDALLKIIFAGNIGTAQGLDILVDVAHKFKTDAITSVHFTLLGNGRYCASLKARISDEQLDAYFTFIDAVKRDEVPQYLSKHDLGFVSLRRDAIISRTLPAKVQSYMAAGIPILASCEGETQRVIQDSDCGFCAESEDADALKAVILQCLALNPQVLEQKGENGYTYSRSHFDLKHLTQKLLSVIDWRISDV